MEICPEMLHNLDLLIDLNQKKVKLLMDMKRGLEEASADYIVCRVGFGDNNRMNYALVKKNSSENLIVDVKSKVEEYIKKKCLTNVYWRQYIEFNTEKQVLELI